jgi:hypothetical protein
MAAPEHVLRVAYRRGADWVAHCRCGFTTVRRDRPSCVAMLYKHTIDAARDTTCPTPHKKGHGTADEAEAALGRFLRRQRPGARPTRIYLCQCRKWHTTKSPARPDHGVAA